jgi:hypothetical protein
MPGSSARRSRPRRAYAVAPTLSKNRTQRSSSACAASASPAAGEGSSGEQARLGLLRQRADPPQQLGRFDVLAAEHRAGGVAPGRRPESHEPAQSGLRPSSNEGGEREGNDVARLGLAPVEREQLGQQAIGLVEPAELRRHLRVERERWIEASRVLSPAAERHRGSSVVERPLFASRDEQ